MLTDKSIPPPHPYLKEWDERVVELQREIARLKAENHDLSNELADAELGPTMVQNQRVEIERLRAALLEIDRVAVSHERGSIGIAQRIAREALHAKDLQASNEQ